jgi:hypothetical protein
MLFQDEAKVLEAISTAHDLHVHIPLIIPVQDRLDEMRLPISDIKEHAIVLQNS